MVLQASTAVKPEIVYPERDGKPMSDDTIQFRWIMITYHNLDWLFADDPNIFVAGDLLWYPVEGSNTICQAPDVMVAFGVAKGDRGSYQQWKEGNIAPQVVFEILSPSNTQTEMNKKLMFYTHHGVEEYYLYDPVKQDLSGWIRTENGMGVIESMDGWVSPRLGIRFDMSGGELQLYRPSGEPFATYTDVQRRLQQREQQLEQAAQQLEQTEQQLEQERQRAKQAEQRAEQLARQLREMGIDPDRLL